MDQKAKEKILAIDAFKGNQLLDALKLYEYLENITAGDISVETLKKEYGGEKLRTYTILFEMEQKGIIEITERSSLGQPKRCKLTSTY